jgi:CO dehydrogenase maturation factor
MGLFHCPCGASYYDDDACVDCGMCYAKTSAERIEASRKIRAFFQAHAVKTSAPRRIAVCGKGGVGKSTITALLTRALSKAGRRVLVLDTDESNPGLFRLLGLARLPRTLITIRRPAPDEPAPDGAWLDAAEIPTASIPEEYLVRQNGVRFAMVGKIEDPFQGCACSIAGVARDLMEKLVVGDDEVVVIDMEAGVESFGRGVERYVDTVLMVVEPSYESMALAEKIAWMAQGMGIARIAAILNKVPSEKVRERMAAELSRKGLAIAGAVRYDARLNEAGFTGEPIATETADEDMSAVAAAVLATAGTERPAGS